MPMIMTTAPENIPFRRPNRSARMAAKGAPTMDPLRYVSGCFENGQMGNAHSVQGEDDGDFGSIASWVSECRLEVWHLGRRVRGFHKSVDKTYCNESSHERTCDNVSRVNRYGNLDLPSYPLATAQRNAQKMETAGVIQQAMAVPLVLKTHDTSARNLYSIAVSHWIEVRRKAQPTRMMISSRSVRAICSSQANVPTEHSWSEHQPFWPCLRDLLAIRIHDRIRAQMSVYHRYALQKLYVRSTC